MALWVCGGEGGCGTKYAVGLSRCPRCHNTDFFEDGDPMAKISRHGGPSDDTLPVAEPETGDAAPEAEPEAETEQVPEEVPAVEPEGGEEPSPGSSSSASTDPQPTNSEPSETPPPSRARKTASRSRRGQTESSSASGTDGGQETGTSATDAE
jgi:hypothetical protein